MAKDEVVWEEPGYLARMSKNSLEDSEHVLSLQELMDRYLPGATEKLKKDREAEIASNG